MWFVLSTPDPYNVELEEVWECPTNWIKLSILHYPGNTKKSRPNLLDLVKKRVEPEADWIITKNFKFISTPEGITEFRKLKYLIII